MRQSTRRAGSTARSTGRARRTVVAIATVAMLSVVAFAPAAHAADTVTTFSLTGGTLSLSAQANAALGSVATGELTLAGSLGATSVTDSRGAILGWVASVVSTDFASAGSSIPAASADYAPGAVAKTGTVTVAAGAGGPMAVSQVAVTGTLVSGNNTASWTPGITLTFLPGSLAGSYSGTVTHSVI